MARWNESSNGLTCLEPTAATKFTTLTLANSATNTFSSTKLRWIRSEGAHRKKLTKFSKHETVKHGDTKGGVIQSSAGGEEWAEVKGVLETMEWKEPRIKDWNWVPGFLGAGGMLHAAELLRSRRPGALRQAGAAPTELVGGVRPMVGCGEWSG
jgi:hypothetical protein